MPWITLTADALRSRLAEPELTALRTIALAPAQPDPVPEVVASVVEEVRGHVAGCARNTLGESGMIPKRLESAALAIARWRLISRLPVKALATEVRRQEYEDAVDLMKSVASCKFSVDAPDVPQSPPESSAQNTPRIRPKPRRPL